MKKNAKKLTKDQTLYQVLTESETGPHYSAYANSEKEAIEKVKLKFHNPSKHGVYIAIPVSNERVTNYLTKSSIQKKFHADSKTKDFGNEQNVRFAVCYEDENGEEMYASLPMRSDIETKSAAQDYFEKWMKRHGEKYSRIKWVEYFKGYKPYDMVLDKKTRDEDLKTFVVKIVNTQIGGTNPVKLAVKARTYEEAKDKVRKMEAKRGNVYKVIDKKAKDSKKTINKKETR